MFQKAQYKLPSPQDEENCQVLSLPFSSFLSVLWGFKELKPCLFSRAIKHHLLHDTPRNQSHILSSV